MATSGEHWNEADILLADMDGIGAVEEGNRMAEHNKTLPADAGTPTDLHVTAAGNISTPTEGGATPLRIAVLHVQGGQIGITFAPGKQQLQALSGAHQRDLAADLDVIAAWNAAAVVTLVEPHELDSLGIAALGEEVRRRHMEWHHWPIRDFGVPDETFNVRWPDRSSMLRLLLACGGRVLIHCKGGLGRAGMVAARILVETGAASEAAIAAVRAVRSPRAVETAAQELWVAAGEGKQLSLPGRGYSATHDRAVGAMLGLAVGDALGAVLEFAPKPRHALLTDMVPGGPHRLQRGQWTDDTAMALALADSLLDDPELDATDLMKRFVEWQTNGTYSCTGSCFDIGIQTAAALDSFRSNGNPLAGVTDPAASGNGALMRLAPVAVRHWRNRETLLHVAELQTRTTHGSAMTLNASRILAELLAGAIAGDRLDVVLSSPAAAAIEGGWSGLHRDAICGSGWVVRTLQAAVWAVSRTTSFRSAVLLAANLGDDADTTAAVAGQLAGAIYGVSGIPPDWLSALAWRERLQTTAERLDAAGGLCSQENSCTDPDWVSRVRQGDFLALPSPFVWERSAILAHLIDGYQLMGGSAETARFANDRLSGAQKGRGWHGSAKELWVCLFFEHRRWRHAGIEASTTQVPVLDALCDALRSRLEHITAIEKAELIGLMRMAHD